MLKRPFSILIPTALTLAVMPIVPGGAAAQEPAWKTESVLLPSTPGPLFGSLVLPSRSSKPVPLAIIIAGSGSIDRNGNPIGMPSGPDDYRQLADGC